ncbi:MAG: STAS domain-containing protein [Motiliproteus sp.]
MDAHLSAQQQGNHCALQISGELTVYATATLKDALLGYLDDSQHMEVNLADVEEMDTAGFQLLYLLKREAQLADKTLSLVAHSAATLEVFELLNMEVYFGDPLVLAS